MIAKPTWITANGALKYHKESKDNYYQKEGDLGEWQGEGAKALGLSGAINEKDLENILWGRDKDGNELVQARLNEEGDRIRAGLDLTFNAPKSVSIAYELALGSGNEELAKAILGAHNEIVDQKMGSFEKLLQSRETLEGETKVVTTGKMVAAKFTHFISRPVEHESGEVTVDPQLHTHAVLMNVTQLESGEWRAIETRDIFDNYMNLGKEYRVDLAAKLSELGFEVEITDQDKAYFEIKLTGDKEKDGAIIEAMSQRAKEVKNTAVKLKEEMPNASDSELKQHAAWQSRTWKDGNLDRRQIVEDNIKRAEELGLTPDMIKTKEAEKLSGQDREELIKLHLQNAIEVLEENTSVFNTHDLLSTAGALGMRHGIDTQEYIPYLTKNKELVDLSKGYYTTKTILANEKELIEAVKETNAEKAFENTLSKKEIRERLEKYNEGQKYALNKGQMESVELILNSKEQIIGIQGDAGTGKTSMLKALNSIKNSDTKIIGLSYTGKAAKEIELKTEAERMALSSEIMEQSGIKSRTVASFLESIESEKIKKEDYKDSIIIVDESSFLGTKDASKLVSFAKESGAKIVKMGDEKQMKAINAGDPFRLLKHHAEMKTANMDEVLRQETPELKHAVKLLNEYKAVEALEYLDKKGMIHELVVSEEVNDKREAIRVAAVDRLVDSYFDNSKNQLVIGAKETSRDPLIFTSTNKTKDLINDQIHAQKVERGEIKELQTTTIRASTNLRPSQKLLTESYKEGHDIAFLRKEIKIDEELTLKKGDEFKIVAPTEQQIEENTLTLEGKDGQKHTINLSQHGQKLETFYQRELEIGEGSKIVFTKNDRKIGVQNGVTAEIKSIRDGQVTAKLTENGKSVSFSLDNYQYIDNGYALTTHKSQGQTSGRVIAFLDSNMQDFSSFYVATTRAAKHLEIYTDSKEQLANNIEVENIKYNATTLFEQLKQEEKEYLDREENRLYNSDATKGQTSVIEKMAKWLDIEESPKFEKYGEAREWIDANMESFKAKLAEYEEKLEGAPTEKQTELVAKIAKSLKMEEEPEIKNYKEAKEFIKKHIEAYSKNIEEYIKKLDGPATEKQIQLTQSISTTLNLEINTDESLTYGEAKSFINKHIEAYQSKKLEQRTVRITAELGIEPPEGSTNEEIKAWINEHKDQKSEFRDTIKELAEIRLEQALEKQENLSSNIPGFTQIIHEIEEFKAQKTGIKSTVRELYCEMKSAENDEQKSEIQTKIEELKKEREDLKNPLDLRIEADSENKALRELRYVQKEIGRAGGLIDKASLPGKPIFDSDIRFLANGVGTKEGYKNFDEHFMAIPTVGVEFELPGIVLREEGQEESEIAEDIALRIKAVADRQFKDGEIEQEDKDRADRFAKFIKTGADEIALKPLINKGISEEELREDYTVEQIKQEAAALDFGRIDKEAKDSFLALLQSNNELQKDDLKSKYSQKMINHLLEKGFEYPQEQEQTEEQNSKPQEEKRGETSALRHPPQRPSKAPPKQRIHKNEIEMAKMMTDNEMKISDPSPVLDALGIDYRKHGNRYEFKARDERTASANLWLDKTGEWRYNDFGGGAGNVAHLARDILGTNYKEAKIWVLEQLGVRDYVGELFENLKQNRDEKPQISVADIEAAKERMQEASKAGRQAEKESKVLEVMPIDFTSEKVQGFLEWRGFTQEKMPEWAYQIKGEYKDVNGKVRQAEGIGVVGDNGSADIHYYKPIFIKSRNDYIKAITFENKDITTLEPVQESDKKSLIIAESKNDAIAAYHQMPEEMDKSTVLIANGTGLAGKIVETMKNENFDEVTILNQNDKAGEVFKDFIIEEAQLKEWKEVTYEEGEWKKDINDLHKDGVKIKGRFVEKTLEPTVEEEIEQKIEKGELKEAAELLEEKIEEIESDKELEKLEQRIEAAAEKEEPQPEKEQTEEQIEEREAPKEGEQEGEIQAETREVEAELER